MATVGSPPAALPAKRTARMLRRLLASLARRNETRTYPALEAANLPPTRARLEIVRDGRGIPHIYAEHDADLFAALGYLQAADRFVQLDIIRHIGAGRVCELAADLPAPRKDEWFGGKRLSDLDAFVRPLSLVERSREDFGGMDERARECLTAFASGVNAAVRAMDGVYPSEYLALAAVREWEASDCLLAARTSALLVSMVNFDSELTFDAVRSAVGDVVARKIYPDAPWEAVPTTYSARGAMPPETPLHPPMAGSNSWAVASARSRTHAPLLANDPHVPVLPLPTYWHHVHIEGPRFRAQGGMFPGCPVLGFGHNGHFAWSVTTGYRDSWDFYRIRREVADPTRYATINGPGVIQRHSEPLSVRFGRSGRSIEWESCEHGIILPGWKHHDGADLAIRQVPSDAGMYFEGHLALLASQTVAEHRAALARIHEGPFDFNHVYAHRDGFIGWELYGRLPRRRGDGLFVRDADDPAGAWDGYLSFPEMPKMLAPAAGVVASANSIVNPADYKRIATKVHFEPRYRQARIEDLLAHRSQHTIDGFADMQRDVEADHLLAPRAGFIRLCKHAGNPIDGDAAQALDILDTWNGVCDLETRGMAVFFYARKEMARLCFTPLLGAAVARRYLAGRRVLPRMHDLLSDSHDPLIEEIERAAGVTLSDLAVRALQHAVAKVRAVCGNDPQKWLWGRIQRARLGVLLSELPLYGRRLLALDEPFPGEEYTLSPARCLDERGGLRLLVGASSRFLCDLSKPEEAYFAHSSGPSADVGSAFHANLSGPWAKFEYFRSCLWKPNEVPDVVERLVIR
ncbi:MAG TPA: penicillin acylase family protein [Candidatus Limnocylindrales bacterium]|nr:penicillin acylase family protein [Candidatus Limnocylindrales bacterium]